MENNASWPTKPSIALPEEMRDRLTGLVAANDGGAIRIIAASAQNWPELTRLGVGEVALGEDGLIRVAMWSASKGCATLIGTRRASLLLSERFGLYEIRCLVLANASLETPYPLSGFLLKPVEFEGWSASQSAPDHRRVRHSPEDIRIRESITRFALFDAFPVTDDGETALFRGASSA
ncbi:MAG: hypothetical protein WDN69_17175 [Aliidongia sp.]